MSYTLMYLKWVVVILLAILMVFSLVAAAIFVGAGIFGAAQEMNATFLILIPAGIFLGLVGFVFMDCFKYLIDKWGMSK